MYNINIGLYYVLGSDQLEEIGNNIDRSGDQRCADDSDDGFRDDLYPEQRQA